MKQIHKYCKNHAAGSGTRGGLTVFTAILVLLLMTALMVYATRTGVFETRVSSNEVRQKQAFHVAEAAVEQGIMYLLSNANLVLSSQVDKFPDGSGFTRDGWLAAGNVRWQPCPAPAGDDHPCGGDFAATAGSLFYDTDGNPSTVEGLPVNTVDFPVGTTARMSALLCYIQDVGTPTVCSDPTGLTEEEENDASLAITLLSYGYSDCTNVNDLSTCTGEATVAQPASNYKNLEGSPAVPLVSKSTVPEQGTVEVVANPNGGGVGVPLTTWVNNNTACPPTIPILSQGTWQTCEYHEWYHVAEIPDGVTCTDNNCMCGPGGNDPRYFMSYKTSTETNIDLDIIIDPLFPCDLFEFYFGYPRAQYHLIKNQAQILSDCSSLGPQSSGLIWISGPSCEIRANTIIGSPKNPVTLISAATSTVINGGMNLYGVLYIFDGEDPNAKIRTLGSAAVYGAAIIDATIEQFQGTFQVVYAGGVLANARGASGLGAVNGGWRDFGLPEIDWPVIASP